jgi:hypothetical protein
MFPSTLQHSIFQTTEALQMLVEWLTSLTWKKAEWMKGRGNGRVFFLPVLTHVNS